MALEPGIVQVGSTSAIQMHGLLFTVAGFVVGVAIGATGVGGGSLMTPMLILLFGISPVIAVGTDLLYAAITKSFAVVLHGTYGSVDWRIVGLQALGSLPAAFLCLWWLRHYPEHAQLSRPIGLVLCAAILLTGIFILFNERLRRVLRSRPSDPARSTESHRRLLTVLSGALIGAMVTFTSVGAGAIGLMLLILLYPRIEPIRLVGSDLAHCVLVTALAGTGYAAIGNVDYRILGALLVGGFPGIWLGARVGFRMNASLLRRLLAVVLIVAGVSILWRMAGN